MMVSRENENKKRCEMMQLPIREIHADVFASFLKHHQKSVNEVVRELEGGELDKQSLRAKVEELESGLKKMRKLNIF